LKAAFARHKSVFVGLGGAEMGPVARFIMGAERLGMTPHISTGGSQTIEARVLHIIPGIAPWMGGPTKAIKTIVEEQLSRGLKVAILTTDCGLSAQEIETLESRLPVIICKANLYVDISFGMVLWLQKNLRQFDVIHIHSFFSFPCIVGAYWAKRLGVPYIIRPCGALDTWSLEQKSLKKRLFLKGVGTDLLNGAAALHVTSNLEGAAAHNLQIRSQQFRIPLGFHINQDNAPSEEMATGQAQRPITFLFLARLHPKKNLEGTLEAFAKVQTLAKDSKLLIAGGGPPEYVRQLKDKTEQLNIEGQCEFLGHVSGAEKQKVYAHSDVYLLPSWGENFGISVVEAMDNGLPVVVSDAVGVESAVSEYNAGVVVPVGDTEALVKGMQTCLDPDFRQTCAANAKSLVAAEFEVSVMGARLEEMYQEVLSR
tara:strand:+ start:722 stop:1999 length:1278 start_codon:yes stop_codon:yes gene_type:complete